MLSNYQCHTLQQNPIQKYNICITLQLLSSGDSSCSVSSIFILTFYHNVLVQSSPVHSLLSMFEFLNPRSTSGILNNRYIRWSYIQNSTLFSIWIMKSHCIQVINSSVITFTKSHHIVITI